MSLPKRIIICCDGTWQSAVNGEKNCPSNVTRLARCLERVGTDPQQKQWQQIVWYDSGVGTTSGWLGKKLEGAIGKGLEGNVIEAYNFCVLNYSPGDQILCFGFSRGAYTARSIAGLISDIGICEPKNLEKFHEIWELYKATEPGERFYGSDKYFDYVEGVAADPEDQPEDLGYKNANFKWISQAHGDWARPDDPTTRDIECVGVYDTVGALGMPSVFGYEAKILFGPDKLGFHNVRLSRNIKNAFHALALDEHREAFTPTLWHLPEHKETAQADLDAQVEDVEVLRSKWYKIWQDKMVPKAQRDQAKADWYAAWRERIHMEERKQSEPNLLQVWFPGVHINIGGGSSDTLKDKGDLEETSNVTFAWMLDQITKYATVDKRAILGEAAKHQAHILDLNFKAQDNQRKLAEQKEAAKKESYLTWGYKQAAWLGNKVIHPLTPTEKLDTTPREVGWGTGTIIDSYTWMYAPNGSAKRTPGAYTKDKKGDTPGKTNEQIHPSVGWRVEFYENKEEAERYYPCGIQPGKPGAFSKRRKTSDGKGYEYVINGVQDPMPEYKLASAPPGTHPLELPFERFAVLGEGAHGFMRKLDAQTNVSPQLMGNPFSTSARYH